MINKTTKLRWRRKLRRSQQQVEVFSSQAEQGIEQHFFKRLYRLSDVRRFVVAWVLLVVFLGVGVVMQVRALSPYYQTLAPSKGGIYTEGVLGTFTTSNPLYATSPVDSSVSRLIFSSLLKYNSQNKLVGDLAQDFTADKRSAVFTVTLKPNITWHDNTPLTADDIVFTYGVIQNPDAKSPLLANWSGVKVEKLSPQTVKFTLPHPLSSFPNLLTTGIVPKHLLSATPVSQLRTIDFNTTNPVGSGPFQWGSIQISGQTPETREEQIGLNANKDYYGGEPNLDSMIIKAIHTKDRMIDQFKHQQIDAMVGLDTVPNELKNDVDITDYEVPLNAQVMVFLKSSSDIMGDKSVRQALTQATNRGEIIRGLGYAVIPVDEPLLRTDLGYNKKYEQLPYNPKAAEALLDKAGWKKGADGIRRKNNVPLAFQLDSQNNSEYAEVAQTLQRQWQAIGVKMDVSLQEDAELQSTLALHNYDALLYGITVGNDPDVYAYWHSSQADVRASNRLNFAELKSAVVDSALEGGRTRTDERVRAVKYQPFLEAWRDAAPAIGLYQPRFLYITRGKVYGFDASVLNTATDRYSNVQNWRFRTARVTIQ